MAKTKKGDFVEIDYVAKEKDTGRIFDLTSAAIAKKEGIKQGHFHPISICIGEGDVVPGLDESLVDKEAGKSFSVDIPSAKAFGPKNQKYVQLIATNKLLKNNIKPYPGLQLDVDNMIGVVRSVSGGRTLVDFNHPLAGRDVTYDVTINKILTTTEEKLKAFLGFHLHSHHEIPITIEKDTATITFNLPGEFQTILSKKINKCIPEIKHILYKTDTKQ